MVACYWEYCVDAQKQHEIHVILIHVYLALKAVLWGEPFPLQAIFGVMWCYCLCLILV